LRSMDLITFEALTGFDPIAVAAALAGTDSAAQLAAHEYIYVKYRMRSNGGASPHASALAEYRSTRLAMIESFAKQHKLPLTRLLASPVAEGGALSYCPACGAQYRFQEGFCVDCPEVALMGHRPEGVP
jgi:hypothetical protein